MFSSFYKSTFHPGKPQQLQVGLVREGQRRGWGTSLAALHHCCHPTKESKMTEAGWGEGKLPLMSKFENPRISLGPTTSLDSPYFRNELATSESPYEEFGSSAQDRFLSPPYPWQAWADWHDLALTNRISTRPETGGAPCWTIIVYDLKGIVELKQILEKQNIH